MKHYQNAGNNDIKALQTNEKQHISPQPQPSLSPGSPPTKQDTASTIINRPPNLVNPGKRKRSPTPQPSSKDGMALRDVFFTHVKNIFAAASPELSLYSDNRTRNGEHAAYYIGWYLDRAVKCALQDLQREVRE
ncbi:unnamed protein product [Adineta steineri]|uniref:Uncharacterized protein n=1 Tax=Adineta steineri TaxID=433720 RepID=A0A819FCY0_9BILA|nr:unnamed protein product [Adineta steineri]